MNGEGLILRLEEFYLFIYLRHLAIERFMIHDLSDMTGLNCCQKKKRKRERKIREKGGERGNLRGCHQDLLS
jgi:hypothetical protein